MYFHSKRPLALFLRVKASFYFPADSPVDINPISRNMATISGTLNYRSSVTERLLKQTTEPFLSRKLKTRHQRFLNWLHNSWFCWNFITDPFNKIIAYFQSLHLQNVKKKQPGTVLVEDIKGTSSRGLTDIRLWRTHIHRWRGGERDQGEGKELEVPCNKQMER